jgi:hypothetical protein
LPHDLLEFLDVKPKDSRGCTLRAFKVDPGGNVTRNELTLV